MQYKEIIRILNDIEDNVSISKIEYKNLKIWPLLRLEVWKNLQQGTAEILKGKLLLRDYSDKIKRKLSSFKKPQYEESSTVCLVARYDRIVKVDGKYFSRFSNSLEEIMEEAGLSFSTLDLSRNKVPVWGQAHFIDRETTDWSFDKSFADIIGWNDFESYVNSKFPEIKIDKNALIKNSQAILNYQNIFERILGQIKPKVCFLECWYHPITMGYIRAGRKLGIKTIDIQHGEQHGMYRGWANLPKSGYDIMPNLFWCWGEESAIEINKWSITTDKEHHAFVAGNPWISRLMSLKTKSDNTNSKDINVVIALPGKDFPLEHLFDAIKKSPSNIRWLVSVHPMRIGDKIFMEKIKKEFEKTENKNIEIQNENGPSFYDFLLKADFLITPWSTTVYEALAFGAHPILINADNMEVFKHYVEKGYFSFADTSEKILEILRKDKSEFNFKEETPYIETDREKIKTVLKDLVK